MPTVAADLFDELPGWLQERRELRALQFAATPKKHSDNSLKPTYLGTLARNLELLDAARKILDAAEAQRIVLLPIKGIVLADLVWGDPGARPMADLDLAVRPAELHRAVALMRELGYKTAFAPRARFNARHGHDVAFVDLSTGIVVEVHHRLWHELAADGSVEPLFERAIDLELLGKTRAAPSWDDHLFLVAVHAATHAFGDSPCWVIDAALLAERASVENAQREAERRRAGYAFRAALRTANRVLPRRLPFPPADKSERWRERLLDLTLGERRVEVAPTHARSLLARAILTERPRDALAEIARKLELRAVELLERISPSRKSDLL